MYNHIGIIRWIKVRIPFGLKIILIRFIVWVENVKYVILHLYKKEFDGDKKMFLLLSTDYSNLGDHAMTYAHKRYLSENYPEYQIYEILVGDTMKMLYSIKKSLSPHDVITLKGGGNVGVEYFREELIRRKIVSYFPNNKIIMFPQTVYFPDTKFGKQEFNNSVRIYNSNPNFYSFFRDRVSYELMGPHLNKAYLTPDIVLSLGKIDIEVENKSGAMTCLRTDVEGIYTENERKMVGELLKKEYCSVKCTDTIRDYKIELQDREIELINIWKEIGSAELLVTDRLHGMIFAALLGTPCIIFNTYNHKLRAQYEWLKDLNYIKMVDLDEKQLKFAIDEIKSIKPEKLSKDRYNQFFKQIVEVISKF